MTFWRGDIAWKTIVCIFLTQVDKIKVHTFLRGMLFLFMMSCKRFFVRSLVLCFVGVFCCDLLQAESGEEASRVMCLAPPSPGLSDHPIVVYTLPDGAKAVYFNCADARFWGYSGNPQDSVTDRFQNASAIFKAYMGQKGVKPFFIFNEVSKSAQTAINGFKDALLKDYTVWEGRQDKDRRDGCSLTLVPPGYTAERVTTTGGERWPPEELLPQYSWKVDREKKAKPHVTSQREFVPLQVTNKDTKQSMLLLNWHMSTPGKMAEALTNVETVKGCVMGLLNDWKERAQALGCGSLAVLGEHNHPLFALYQTLADCDLDFLPPLLGGVSENSSGCNFNFGSAMIAWQKDVQVTWPESLPSEKGMGCLHWAGAGALALHRCGQHLDVVGSLQGNIGEHNQVFDLQPALAEEVKKALQETYKIEMAEMEKRLSAERVKILETLQPGDKSSLLTILKAIPHKELEQWEKNTVNILLKLCGKELSKLQKEAIITWLEKDISNNLNQAASATAKQSESTRKTDLPEPSASTHGAPKAPRIEQSLSEKLESAGIPPVGIGSVVALSREDRQRLLAGLKRYYEITQNANAQARQFQWKGKVSNPFPVMGNTPPDQSAVKSIVTVLEESA